MPVVDITIAPIFPEHFEQFIRYLNRHLADNGQGGVYFQPLPRSASFFSDEHAAAFRNGLGVEIGQPGWRRLWGAFSPEQQLIGHIDLRARPEPDTGQRCLLGMGVDTAWRQQGLGRRLLAHAQQWAGSHAGLAWIDLQVLSVNAPALALYRRAGFEHSGKVAPMFQIDGQWLSYINMSKQLTT